jgi:hypothetical protein
MPRTNRPLDHRLPFLRGPIKGCGPPLKHTAPHTPSPFASLRLKVPLNEAHRPPAPIFAARPSPATPRQAITSNGFPYVPPTFSAPHGDTPAMETLARPHSGKPATTSAQQSMVHHLKLWFTKPCTKSTALSIQKLFYFQENPRFLQRYP